MKTNPNKLITIRANFADSDPALEEDIESITARLYKEDQHITDLPVIRVKPLDWKIHHVFPIESQLGEYQAIVEVKIKNQKDPLCWCCFRFRQSWLRCHRSLPCLRLP